METIKLVVVGDGCVGKTSLLITYATGEFPCDYLPNTCDIHTSTVMYDGSPVSLQLWDTNAQEDYGRLRPLSYPETDVFLVCYSVDRIASLENIQNKWVSEIRSFFSDTSSVPIILVGLKSDLRSNESVEKASMVTDAQSLEMVERIEALKCLECSSLKGTGMKEVFDESIRAALAHKKDTTRKKASNCMIL